MIGTTTRSQYPRMICRDKDDPSPALTLRRARGVRGQSLAQSDSDLKSAGSAAHHPFQRIHSDSSLAVPQLGERRRGKRNLHDRPRDRSCRNLQEPKQLFVSTNVTMPEWIVVSDRVSGLGRKRVQNQNDETHRPTPSLTLGATAVLVETQARCRPSRGLARIG